jgi:hypothetical protein
MMFAIDDACRCHHYPVERVMTELEGLFHLLASPSQLPLSLFG